MSSYYEKMLATGEVKCIDEEVPFEIPVGWEWCRMRDVIQLLSGRDLEPSMYNSSQKGIPYITGASNFNNENLIVNRWTQTPVTVSEEGDLLITCKGTIGTMAFNNIGSIHIARQIMAIQSKDVDLHYLKSYFELNIGTLESQANSMIPGISREVVLNSLVPIPPLQEQIKIVEKCNSLMPLVSKYSIAQGKLNLLNNAIKIKLEKTILQEAVKGKLVPQLAEEGTAQELLEQIKTEKQKLVKEGNLKKSALNDSVIFRGDDNRYYEQVGSEVTEIELPFDFPSTWSIARLNAVCQLTDGLKTIGKQCLLDAKYLRGKSSETIVEQGKLVYKGDNIMLVDGENSGEVFIVPQDGYMGSTFKQLWISSSMYEPYVLAFIQFYKETLRNSKKGAAIPHLNKELFYGLIIGIPPLQEQRRIVQKIEDSSQLLK